MTHFTFIKKLQLLRFGYCNFGNISINFRLIAQIHIHLATHGRSLKEAWVRFQCSRPFNVIPKQNSKYCSSLFKYNMIPWLNFYINFDNPNFNGIKGLCDGWVNVCMWWGGGLTKMTPGGLRHTHATSLLQAKQSEKSEMTFTHCVFGPIPHSRHLDYFGKTH